MSFWQYLILIFTIAFLGMVVIGAILIYDASINIPNQPTSLETNMKTDGFSLKLETAIPGVVVFTIGALGLIMTLIKIPIKEIAHYKSGGFDDSGDLQRKSMHDHAPTYGVTIRVPYLLWLLRYKKENAIRVK